MYKITEKQINKKKISDILYGNFIELGYGIQVESMWSEMLFNRSFEPFLPYRDINKEWYDLFYKKEDGTRDYERDWRKFDWYHSGYEHNCWFAAPNDVETYLIDDNSTFVVETTEYSDSVIKTVEGGVHGSYCMQIQNESAKKGGMAQRGKVLKKDNIYNFSGYFKKVCEKPDITVTVSLMKDGDFADAIDSFTFTLNKDRFIKYEYQFKSTIDGRAMLVVWVENGTVEVDCFSLMPADTCFGWRKDVIKAAKEVNPKIIRWPGGCFASFYDWKEAIGPFETRIPSKSFFWGGYNYNDVGSMELGNFCEALNSEQMICVNLFHPNKEYYDVHFDNDNKAAHGQHFPQFMDIEEGAKFTADWVAYMNSDESRPMGALRAQHGRSKPFNVRYWEIDNEPLRWFKPNEYAEAVVVYSKAMKKVDPNIKIGLVTYGFGDDPKVISSMLDIAGKHIDFFADRGPDLENLAPKLSVMRTYNAENGTDIRYCNTEWLPLDMFMKADSFNWVNGDKCFMFSKWRYSINIFRQIMMWQREGGDVLFVNFNNFANTHSQNVIDSPKEGVYVTASGRAMGLMASSPAAWVLEIEDYKADLSDSFQVQAAWNEERDALVLYVFNLTNERKEATFDYSFIEKGFSKSNETYIYAELYDMNTLNDQDRIKQMKLCNAIDINSRSLSVIAPKYSFGMVILER